MNTRIGKTVIHFNNQYMSIKSIFSVLGIIVLGALGSGLWELTKPIIGLCVSWMLTVSTLGMDSLRDGIYADTANAIVRPSAFGVVVPLIAMLVSIVGILLIRSIQISSQSTSKFFLFSFGMLFAFATLTIVEVERNSYVNQLAIYSLKLEVMAAPYISDVQLKQIRAKYAQIDSRATYIAQVDALRKIIEEAGQKAPTRNYF